MTTMLTFWGKTNGTQKRNQRKPDLNSVIHLTNLQTNQYHFLYHCIGKCILILWYSSSPDTSEKLYISSLRQARHYLIIDSFSASQRWKGPQKIFQIISDRRRISYAISPTSPKAVASTPPGTESLLSYKMICSQCCMLLFGKVQLKSLYLKFYPLVQVWFSLVIQNSCFYSST